MKHKGESWQSHIDQVIAEAIERGEFDYSNLKGKKLGQNPSEAYEGERAMANKVLKNSGYAPDFILKKREIDEALEKHREMLVRYLLRHQRLIDAAERASDEAQRRELRAQADEDWKWAVRQVEKALPGLNEQIALFNLMNKIPSLYKRKLTIEKEIERARRQVEGR